MKNDTIAAVATPAGHGGIGIIRISGSEVKNEALKILKRIPQPRYAEYLKFYNSNNEIIDEGISLLFPAPRSYTGEDVLELQCHGGPVVLDILLSEILKNNNIRQANPGEFTERAFLNGKMDLAQAEAVADLIDADSKEAARNAINSMQGVFSKLIQGLNEDLKKLRTYVEATIDFPEESIDFISDGQVIKGLNNLIDTAENTLQKAKQGILLREGFNLVIAGVPNAGKSSLMNALCGRERAIVTSFAGTTRDVIHEDISIQGMPIHITDTAGLRENSDDPIEKIGINKAWDEIKKCRRILFVYDVTRNNEHEQLDLLKNITNKVPDIPCTIAANKIDLNSSAVMPKEFNNLTVIKISAKKNIGIQELAKHIHQVAGFDNNIEGSFSARRRHLTALENTNIHLNKAKELLIANESIEIAAEEMKEAQNSLNSILGRFTSDDLLERIFSTFCVGK